MADNDNTITLVGRIGQEPELRATPKGDVLNFSIATSDRRRTADGGWSDGPTSWFRVAAWHDLGRNAHASFHRGQQVIVRGVLTVREFQVEGGGRSRNAELRATALGHDLRWGTSAYTDGPRPGATQAASSVEQTLPPVEQTVPAGSDPAPTEEQRGGDWGAPAAPQREVVLAGPAAGWAADEDAPF